MLQRDFQLNLDGKPAALTDGWAALTEALITAIHNLLPAAQHLILLVPYPRCRAIVQPVLSVATHYHIPVLNLLPAGRLSSGGGLTAAESAALGHTLWQPCLGATGSTSEHPCYFDHAYFADALAWACKEQLIAAAAAACDKSLLVPGGSWPVGPPLFPAAATAGLVCLEPTTVHSAAAAIALQQARQPAANAPEGSGGGSGGGGGGGGGDWALVEDRVGKPGWIVTALGAVLELPIRFGAKPRLAVTFLRSHSPNMCCAELQLNGISHVLDGGMPSPPDNTSRRLSVAHTEWLEADSYHRHKGFKARPNSTHPATLTLVRPPSRLRGPAARHREGHGDVHKGVAGCKFKLISLIAC